MLVGFGGGVNSTAALVGLYHRHLRPDLITFADTGGEKPETYAFLNTLDSWLVQAGFPSLTRVKKESPRVGDESLEAECLRRETLPSRAFGLSSCAHRWKIEPQEKFLNHCEPAKQCWVAGRKPIKILGYDGGEGRRAQIDEDKKLRYWYPLIEWDWDREACVAEIELEGLPVPPKSACFYCPSSKKSEVIQLSRTHPALYQRAVEMEAKALTSERHDLRNIKGLGRHWSWKTLVEADETERASFIETPVESCVTCDDGDACDL